MRQLRAVHLPHRLKSKRCTQRPVVEALEARLLLSVTAGHIHSLQAPPSIVGTISGKVINDKTGLGRGGIKVELINLVGRVAETTTTNRYGSYSLGVPSDGAFVVREFVPRGWTQTSPTFASDAPTGEYLPGYGAGSWNYTLTNTDPSRGVVGPAGWERLTTVDGDPFGSPVNITRPAIDLSKVVTVDYAPAVPDQIINNGHQIQANSRLHGRHGNARRAGLHAHASPLPRPLREHCPRPGSRMEEHFVNKSASAPRRSSPSSSNWRP